VTSAHILLCGKTFLQLDKKSGIHRHQYIFRKTNQCIKTDSTWTDHIWSHATHYL